MPHIIKKLLFNWSVTKMISSPIVVIFGPTGSGKTKLSLELATKFNSEIIGADSMQIYKGLDIVTAKATKEEQNLAIHHLVDIIDPHETFNVINYRNAALETIENLHTRNKVPIIVGGTNYYIEAILWKILIENPGKNSLKTPGILPGGEHELPSKVLHKKLQDLDPVMAKRLHPNNKRKILRSLEVLYQKGKQHSEILKEQQTAEGGSKTGGALRFQNVIIFWLQCDQDILDARLDARVDSMIEQGLLDELEHFHKLYNEDRVKNNEAPDYTKGIFQSIGFKEFHNYLMLSHEERSSEDGQKLFQKGVDDLKMITRRYARKQKRWITNRFLARSDRQVPPLYGLSTNDVSAFDTNVTKPAIEIVDCFLRGTPIPYEPLPCIEKQSFPNSEDDTFHCEVCSRVFVGIHQWNLHRKSAKHWKMLQRQKRLEGKKVGKI